MEDKMLVDTHDCYMILSDLEKRGTDVSDAIRDFLKTSNVPKIVVEELVKRKDPVAMFYLNLNNKAHKIIKELLKSGNDETSIATYLKLATSIVTQGIIAIEHVYGSSDVEEQNRFIECIGLKELTYSLSIYFKTGDYKPLVSAINNNRTDVKALLD